MAKDNALQKIESHEKLCRIMQKQTHDKIHKIEHQINLDRDWETVNEFFGPLSS